MAKKKFYAVKKGKNIGVFSSWEECQKQVSGFSGSEYKLFNSEDEALEFLSGVKKKNEIILKNTISVDGSCRGNPGIGEYQCVDTDTGELIFKHSGFEDTTNNVMEFLALVDALKYIKENNLDKKIYSDSGTAISWVKHKKANSNLRPTKRNFDSKKMMDLAEEWLNNNDISDIEILKWDTKKLGEIPSDFGNK